MNNIELHLENLSDYIIFLMSYHPTTLKDIVAAGASVKLRTSVHPSTLKELVLIALKSGSKIEVAYDLHPSTAHELAKLAPNHITFVH